jgi:hypothetical protein
MTYNEREFPNIFNRYFSTVGNNLASKMPNSQTTFTHYLPNIHNSSSFAFTPILPHEIEEIMSNEKSPWPLFLSNLYIKMC